MIRYDKYVTNVYDVPFVRRRIKGTFKNSVTGVVVSGDNFDAIVVGDAKQSYEVALDFFNKTRRDGEAERLFVEAHWADEEVVGGEE